MKVTCSNCRTDVPDEPKISITVHNGKVVTRQCPCCHRAVTVIEEGLPAREEVVCI
jgi:endogenous inhibitor of DNA gyrase (YacG/DUF329 family)